MRTVFLALTLGALCSPSAPSEAVKAASSASAAKTAAAGAPSGKAAPAPAAGVTMAAAAAEPGIADLYPVEKMRLRDPFAQLGGVSGAYAAAGANAEFSIHNLILKGIMQDASGDFALLIDAGSGADYVLRKGVLLDMKKKSVAGISGIIKPKQKTVHLLTQEKDVQTFILGEEGGAE